MKVELLKGKHFPFNTCHGQLDINFRKGYVFDNVELNKGRWLAPHPQNKNIYFDLEDAADFDILQDERENWLDVAIFFGLREHFSLSQIKKNEIFIRNMLKRGSDRVSINDIVEALHKRV